MEHVETVLNIRGRTPLGINYFRIRASRSLCGSIEIGLTAELRIGDRLLGRRQGKS